MLAAAETPCEAFLIEPLAVFWNPLPGMAPLPQSPAFDIRIAAEWVCFGMQELLVVAPSALAWGSQLRFAGAVPAALSL